MRRRPPLATRSRGWSYAALCRIVIYKHIHTYAGVNICTYNQQTHTHTTTPQPFYALFRDHPGEPVPEENFWTLWCRGRLTEADTWAIRLGATPSGLTSAHLYHPPFFFTGRMPFLPPKQQCQNTEGTHTHTQTLAHTTLTSFLT